MTLSNMTGRVARAAVLIVVLTMIAGMAPRGVSAAQERGGGSFGSDDYGFAVSWDDRVWEGEELEDVYGIGLYSDLSFARISVMHGVRSADECFTASKDVTSSSDSVLDFGKAPRRYERPETGSEAAGLFLFIDAESGDEIVAHIECHELAASDAALEIVLLAYEPDFEEVLPDWNDLLSDIKVSGGARRDDDSAGDDGNTGLDRSGYASDEAGFAVAVSDDWSLRELEEDEQIGIGVEVSAGSSFGYVSAMELQSSFADCAATYAEGIGNYELISRMKVATSKYDRPATARKAVGELYTFSLSTDGDVTKMVGYFECRKLADKSSALHVFIAVPANGYDEALPLWEDLLGGIEIGNGEDDRGDRGGARGDDEDEPIGRDDASMVSPNFGIVIEFDDTVWAVEDQSDAQFDIVQLESEFGFGTIVGYGDPFDTESCFETLIGLKLDESATNFDVAPESFARPSTSRDAVGELFTYQIAGQDGPIDVALYVECRSAAGGDATVGVTLLTVVNVYDGALPQFEALLSGVGESREG